MDVEPPSPSIVVTPGQRSLTGLCCLPLVVSLLAAAVVGLTAVSVWHGHPLLAVVTALPGLIAVAALLDRDGRRAIAHELGGAVLLGLGAEEVCESRGGAFVARLTVGRFSLVTAHIPWGAVVEVEAFPRQGGGWQVAVTDLAGRMRFVGRGEPLGEERARSLEGQVLAWRAAAGASAATGPRCALCRTPLPAGAGPIDDPDAHGSCDGCGVLTHAGCLSALSEGCPTPGCVRRRRPAAQEAGVVPLERASNSGVATRLVPPLLGLFFAVWPPLLVVHGLLVGPRNEVVVGLILEALLLPVILAAGPRALLQDLLESLCDGLGARRALVVEGDRVRRCAALGSLRVPLGSVARDEVSEVEASETLDAWLVCLSRPDGEPWICERGLTERSALSAEAALRAWLRTAEPTSAGKGVVSPARGPKPPPKPDRAGSS